MSRKKGIYFTVLRQSRTYSGQDEFVNIWQVLKYVYRVYSSYKKYASNYRLTIKEEYGNPPAEKRLYKQLKKKYEGKDIRKER